MRTSELFSTLIPPSSHPHHTLIPLFSNPLLSPCCPVIRFYRTFVSNLLNRYKEVYAAAAEVLGVFLAHLEKTQNVRE